MSEIKMHTCVSVFIKTGFHSRAGAVTRCEIRQGRVKSQSLVSSQNKQRLV